MNQQLLSEIGRTQRLEILNTLKRTKGLSVNELVAKMKMSYMGIKQHCIDLHRRGYLETWRRPGRVGRPEMLYRLTDKAHGLFENESNAATVRLLSAARKLFGASAPEKLLFTFFQEKADEFAARLKAGGELLARDLVRHPEKV